MSVLVNTTFISIDRTIKENDMKKWKPINNMVLVRKDEDKDTTEGGIILPDRAKIPTITCRILEIGPKVDPIQCPIKVYDKVLVKPASAVPLSFDDSNKLYVLDADSILAYEESSTSDIKSETT